MTSLWLICFSLLLVWPVAAAAVSGRVRLVDSLVPAVRKHQDYFGVVVWLEPLPAPPRAPALRIRRATMEQKGKRFIPHILAIQAGADVFFPNLDPIFHNAFSNFSGQIFDLGLYAPGTNRTITFRRTGTVRVFCNIHPTMSAVIVVLKYPWFAVSDATGGFSIADVPPGRYRLHLFHERATPATLGQVEQTIDGPEAGLALGPLSVSETGYVAAPHKNKYGREYPPEAADRSDYPADRK